MSTLLCTRRLVRRLGETPQEGPSTSTKRLGDWYANLLNVERKQLVICMSDRTLLSVLVPIRDPKRLRARVRDAVGRLLTQLGVPEDLVAAEIEGMDQMTIGKAVSLSRLASLQDFAQSAKFRARDDGPSVDLATLQMELAQTPSGALGYRFPSEATMQAFGIPKALARFETSVTESQIDTWASDFLAQLSLSQRRDLAKLHEEALAGLHFSAGLSIRNQFKLHEVSGPFLYSPSDADELSHRILRRAWQLLRQDET
jgi:uncharacterized protein DUF6933